MTRNGSILWLAAAGVALAEPALGQRSANWRVYKMRDGLPDTTCLSATFSPQGKVLVKHLNVSSMSELDGYALTMLPAPPGSSRVYESPGGQRWASASTGLQEMKDGVWTPHVVPELSSTLNLRPNDLISLYPIRQGVVICLFPTSLVELNSTASNRMQVSVLRTCNQTRLGDFSGMIASKDGGLWVIGAYGLAKVPPPLRNLKEDTTWQEQIPPAALQLSNLQQPHEDQSGGVALIAQSSTNHQTVLLYFDGHHWMAQKATDNKIRHAWRGPDGTWWAASINALFHSETGPGDLVETEEISARQYFDVVLEPNGPFWLATSDGLFRFAPLLWRNPVSELTSGALIHCLTGDSQDRLWFLSAGGLHVLQNGQEVNYPLGNTAAQDMSSARWLFLLKDSSLLLAGDEKLVQFHPATGRFNHILKQDNGLNCQAIGLLKDGRACLQRWIGGLESVYSLETFDGSDLHPLPCPTPPVSVGTHLTTFFEAQNGALWIGAEHGTACYHEKLWKVFNAADKSSPDSPTGFLEMADGKIWCATSDKLWQFDGRDWSEVRRGFDRINGVVRSQRDGSVWVASNSGLHRLTAQGTWLENGTEEGLPSMSVRALYEDSRGRLWSGTTRGLSQYDPEADRDPPQTQIEPFSEKDGNLREGVAITLTFTGKDKWKYTARERLLFSYRIDEREWSSFQDERQATFTELLAGKHSFHVRAMDRNGNVDPKPAELGFAVVLPWYRETRLVFISLAGLAVALFFAGLAFNRHHQLVRSYDEVEKKVGERTRELEIASRELLHSQKMNALGTLAAGIAHDFNNILSIIKGSAQIIEDNLENPQKVRTRVDRIKTVVEQGSGIVKAMLGFSRESDQQPGVCAPNSVVEDTIKLLGDRFLREVQVRFEKGVDTALVKCPKDFVQQILINLIFNAAESMDTQKEIVLVTRESATLPRELVLMPASALNYVFVSVRDTGCGIPSENLSRIFEPFFTTKSLSDRRGTGLGLSMVYELAKKVQAGLAVESSIGKGSTFTLILPAAAATSEEQMEMTIEK